MYLEHNKEILQFSKVLCELTNNQMINCILAWLVIFSLTQSPANLMAITFKKIS